MTARKYGILVKKPMFNNMGWRLVRRLIRSSGRFVWTKEFKSEPGLFYVCAGQSVNGPFKTDDNRFMV